jgi:hypothetical protein
MSTGFREHTSETLRLKPSSFLVVPSKLPQPGAGDDDARVLTDSLKMICALIDREGVVSSKPRSSLGESACAIVFHLIFARCGPGTYGAVLARIETKGNTAFPIEILRANLGLRPD